MWKNAKTEFPKGELGKWSEEVVCVTNLGNLGLLSFFNSEMQEELGDKGVWQQASWFVKSEQVAYWTEMPLLDAPAEEAVTFVLATAEKPTVTIEGLVDEAMGWRLVNHVRFDENTRRVYGHEKLPNGDEVWEVGKFFRVNLGYLLTGAIDWRTWGFDIDRTGEQPLVSFCK